MSGEAHTSSPEKENLALELRAVTAEAELRVTKAEAEAKVLVTKAEAEAKVRVAEAEAELRVVKAESELQLERVVHKLEIARRNHAAEHSEMLALQKMRNVRGAVEYIGRLIAGRLTSRNIAVPRGVQALLNAALANDPDLAPIVTLLSTRLLQRERDVLQSFGSIYHTLSKGMHGVGDTVVVRVADFPAPTERLALCALLEAYNIEYTYVDAEGTQTSLSPYALTEAERLALEVGT